MEGIPMPQSTAEYDYADPIELNKFFRISRSESKQTTVEISIGDLGEAASNQQIQQQQQRQENCVRVQNSVPYENVENSDMGENFSVAITSDNGLKTATSYEDLPEGCLGDLPGETCLDPEEYVEMGKRRSVLIVADSGPSGCHGFDKIEEEDPEYYVLEDMETSEGESLLIDVVNSPWMPEVNIRDFKQLLRWRQRELPKTIGFNEKNKGPARALLILVHFFTVIGQREMTKFEVFWRTCAHDGNFFYSLSQLEDHSNLFCYWILRPHFTS